MKILEKNWIYELDLQEDIKIKSWMDLKIFDISSLSKKKFIVQWNCNFSYRILLQEQINFDYDFFFEWEKSIWDIKILILSQSDIKIKWKVNIYINNNNININLKIISIIWEAWYSEIYPNIIISKSIKNSQWNLFQENIFIWKTWKGFAQPALNISSNQIKAFHGVKMEKIDKNKLFYMMSKGINLKNSQNLIILWYFNNFFEWFNINDEKIKWYLTFFEKKWTNQQIW